MFNAYSEPAQGVIVGSLILYQRPSLGFLVGNFNAGMVILKPLVATVGIEVGRRRQRWSAPTDLKIMNPSGRRFGDADDPAILFDNDCGFDRMRFFLPEYQQRCFRPGLWVGYSVQSIIRASSSSRLTWTTRVTPRTRAATAAIRRKDRLMVDLLVWYRQAIKSWVIAHRYRIRRTRR